MDTLLKIKSSGQTGFSLLEVLIGIAIFAIGMMALASLQRNLTRSAADANVRTVATNLAEGLIERRKGFSRIQVDTDGIPPLFPAYDDIINESYTPAPIGGISYTVTAVVTDYYYDLVNDNFTTTAPAGVGVSDFKYVEVTVSWIAQDFRTTEGNEMAIGTGSITVTDTISSVTTSAASRVATQENEELDLPAVDYSPGQNPDIVSLSLGDNKFKESLLPQPDVFIQGELVETRFDVITYSQTGAGTRFLRREEFISLSCECALKAAPGDAESASRRPTIWAGDEYAEGHFVDKPYGVSDSNQNSVFCDVCCQDHHDGGSSADDHTDTAVNQYYPFRATGDYFASGSFIGDHKHYNRNDLGDLVLTDSVNGSYLEACKLVRKDGFFRVAQDFRQEDLNVFPADFLDDQTEIDTYSLYVTGAADAYENASYPDYEAAPAPPCIGGPAPCVAEPTFGGDYPTPLNSGEFPSWTRLSLDTAETQQLRSRGVYIDYLSYDIRTVIDCLRSGGTVDSCQTGDVILDQTGSANILEIIPFFDVQLTLLDRWNETPNNRPVDTTNEGLEDNNTHSRGVASRTNIGCSDVEATGHKGNLGFTDTAPVDFNYSADLTAVIIDVESEGDSGNTECIEFLGDEAVVVGTINESIAGLRATDIDVQGLHGALCDRTPDGYECIVPTGGSNPPRVQFLSYGEDGADRWTCMVGASALVLASEVTNGQNAHATFELASAVDPQPDGSGYDVNIRSTACSL